MQQPVQPKPKSGMPIWQILVILGLLFFIILILIVLIVILVIKKPGGGSIFKNKDNTRTVMIYIDGSNLESDHGIATSELDAIDPSTIDLEHTNILVYAGGTTKWHNFIKNDENAIYKLTSDGFEKIETYPKKNMGDASTFSEFLTYAHDKYPAGHYNLVLWNHGGAIQGAIYDDFTRDNLSLEDFSKALKDSPFNEKDKLETVLFRTCLNGTLEVASVFADYSEYIAFSEEVTRGHSSSNVLGYFLNDLSPKANGVEVGTKFIDAYYKQMHEIDRYNTCENTYSLIDLSKIKPLMDKFDNYMTTVDIQNHYKEISTIRNNLYQYGVGESGYDMIDLKEFILQVKQYASGDADGLIKAFDDAVVLNNTNLAKSHGLSIYFPYKGDSSIINMFMNVYKKLPFKNYYSFMTSFTNTKKNATPFSFNLSTNDTKTDDNEVTMQLTDDQKNNIVRSFYYVFRQEDNKPDYYQIVYGSNNATIEDGVIKTHFNNKLIKFKDGEGGSQYIAVIDKTNDGKTKKTTSAVIVDKDEDVLSAERRVASTIMIEEENGKPKFGNMELISRNQRVEGILYDISKYESIEIMRSSHNILDKNKKVKNPSDWTSPKTMEGLSGDLDKATLEYTGFDNGKFYVVFFLFDYNDNMYTSDLIKVGE